MQSFAQNNKTPVKFQINSRRLSLRNDHLKKIPKKEPVPVTKLVLYDIDSQSDENSSNSSPNALSSVSNEITFPTQTRNSVANDLMLNKTIPVYTKNDTTFGENNLISTTEKVKLKKLKESKPDKNGHSYNNEKYDPFTEEEASSRTSPKRGSSKDNDHSFAKKDDSNHFKTIETNESHQKNNELVQYPLHILNSKKHKSEKTESSGKHDHHSDHKLHDSSSKRHDYKSKEKYKNSTESDRKSRKYCKENYNDDYYESRSKYYKEDYKNHYEGYYYDKKSSYNHCDYDHYNRESYSHRRHSDKLENDKYHKELSRGHKNRSRSRSLERYNARGYYHSKNRSPSMSPSYRGRYVSEKYNHEEYPISKDKYKKYAKDYYNDHSDKSYDKKYDKAYSKTKRRSHSVSPAKEKRDEHRRTERHHLDTSHRRERSPSNRSILLVDATEDDVISTHSNRQHTSRSHHHGNKEKSSYELKRKRLICDKESARKKLHEKKMACAASVPLVLDEIPLPASEGSSIQDASKKGLAVIDLDKEGNIAPSREGSKLQHKSSNDVNLQAIPVPSTTKADTQGSLHGVVVPAVKVDHAITSKHFDAKASSSLNEASNAKKKESKIVFSMKDANKLKSLHAQKQAIFEEDSDTETESKNSKVSSSASSSLLSSSSSSSLLSSLPSPSLSSLPSSTLSSLPSFSLTSKLPCYMKTQPLLPSKTPFQAPKSRHQNDLLLSESSLRKPPTSGPSNGLCSRDHIDLFDASIESHSNSTSYTTLQTPSHSLLVNASYNKPTSKLLDQTSVFKTHPISVQLTNNRVSPNKRHNLEEHTTNGPPISDVMRGGEQPLVDFPQAQQTFSSDKQSHEVEAPLQKTRTRRKSRFGDATKPVKLSATTHSNTQSNNTPPTTISSQFFGASVFSSKELTTDSILFSSVFNESLADAVKPCEPPSISSLSISSVGNTTSTLPTTTASFSSHASAATLSTSTNLSILTTTSSTTFPSASGTSSYSIPSLATSSNTVNTDVFSAFSNSKLKTELNTNSNNIDHYKNNINSNKNDDNDNNITNFTQQTYAHHSCHTSSGEDMNKEGGRGVGRGIVERNEEMEDSRPLEASDGSEGVGATRWGLGDLPSNLHSSTTPTDLISNCSISNNESRGGSHDNDKNVTTTTNKEVKENFVDQSNDNIHNENSATKSTSNNNLNDATTTNNKGSNYINTFNNCPNIKMKIKMQCVWNAMTTSHQSERPVSPANVISNNINVISNNINVISNNSTDVFGNHSDIFKITTNKNNYSSTNLPLNDDKNNSFVINDKEIDKDDKGQSNKEQSDKKGDNRSDVSKGGRKGGRDGGGGDDKKVERRRSSRIKSKQDNKMKENKLQEYKSSLHNNNFYLNNNTNSTSNVNTTNNNKLNSNSNSRVVKSNKSNKISDLLNKINNDKENSGNSSNDKQPVLPANDIKEDAKGVETCKPEKVKSRWRRWSELESDSFESLTSSQTPPASTLDSLTTVQDVTKTLSNHSDTHASHSDAFPATDSKGFEPSTSSHPPGDLIENNGKEYDDGGDKVNDKKVDENKPDVAKAATAAAAEDDEDDDNAQPTQYTSIQENIYLSERSVVCCHRAVERACLNELIAVVRMKLPSVEFEEHFIMIKQCIYTGYFLNSFIYRFH